MSELREQGIVCVATARHPLEAHIWRQALETEGVRCEVVGEFLHGAEGGAPFTPEVWVRRGDADLARAILQVYQQLAANPPAEEEE